MTDNYAQAALELIESGSDIDFVLAGLASTLEKAGHAKLHFAVLQTILRVLKSSSAYKEPLVIIPQENVISSLSSKIRAALKEIDDNKEDFQTKIDDTLIGGFILQYNHRQIDQSYKTKLAQLYQAATK